MRVYYILLKLQNRVEQSGNFVIDCACWYEATRPYDQIFIGRFLLIFEKTARNLDIYWKRGTSYKLIVTLWCVRYNINITNGNTKQSIVRYKVLQLICFKRLFSVVF